MNGIPQSGLEVTPHNGAELVHQPDGNKYYAGPNGLNETVFTQPDQSNHPASKKTSRNKTFWALSVIAILFLAAALGAGLGAGLAAKHKSKTSR